MGAWLKDLTHARRRFSKSPAGPPVLAAAALLMTAASSRGEVQSALLPRRHHWSRWRREKMVTR